MILDTNALSAWAEGIPEVKDALDNASRVAIPSIVLGEYYFGIRQSRYHGRYMDWLNRVASNIEIISVSQKTAGFYAQIRLEIKRMGTRIPSNDTWIVTLAKLCKSPILSNDTHFDRVSGLRMICQV